MTLDGETYCCGYAELGNPGIPHLTVEIPDLLLRIDDEEALGALRMLGRKLRYHPALPKGANVNFYQVMSAAWRISRWPAAQGRDRLLRC